VTHHASPAFWVCYHALPASMQALADKAFGLLKTDPRHPALHFKRVGAFWSARVGLHHRDRIEPRATPTTKCVGSVYRARYYDPVRGQRQILDSGRSHRGCPQRT
jgi:hypothetical protein